MRSSLRAIWLSVRASYWFIPSLLTLFAFLLALVTIRLDRSWGSEWLLAFSWFESIHPEGARAQLTVVTSGMIAISSTLFAITIAAVAFASGNYGPRLLNNFMYDRGNQVSLGVFIATFVYNLLLLRVVRDAQDQPAGRDGTEAITAFVPQLSMLVSGASVVIAVAVLVYFLHHIPSSIRINTVLGGIGKHLIREIERRFLVEGGAEEPFQPEAGTPVTATSIGYIEIVDFARLDRIARDEGIKIALQVRTGDFLHPHLPMVEVSGGPGGPKIKERIRDCFSLGESRTPTQDLEFLIDELVEIGLRALSPGVNDPFTAIACVHWMGAALAKLADRNLFEGPEQHSYDRTRVQPLADDFTHFVKRSFGAFRSSLATSPIAAEVALDALAGVAFGATSEQRRRILLQEGRELMRQAELELEGPALETVQARLAEFEAAMERAAS